MAAIRWQWSARCTSLSLCVLGRGRVSRQRGTTHSAKTVPSSSYTVRTAPQEPSPSRSATVYVLCGSLPEPGHCIASIVRIATSLASPSGRPDGTVLSTSTKVRKNDAKRSRSTVVALFAAGDSDKSIMSPNAAPGRPRVPGRATVRPGSSVPEGGAASLPAVPPPLLDPCASCGSVRHPSAQWLNGSFRLRLACVLHSTGAARVGRSCPRYPA